MKPVSILRRTRSATRRRLASRPLAAALVAAAITVPAAVAVPVAIAAANSPHRQRQSVTASSVSGAAAARAVAAVQQLVRDGTISQQQASAVDDQINAGSIDPGQLVDNRVLTVAQGETVARTIKEALAAGTGSGGRSGGQPKGAAGKKGSGPRG
jgi:Asp-tRNA(Asn)/Glu-tRNA(Gln) amidotransferase B subunit